MKEMEKGDCVIFSPANTKKKCLQSRDGQRAEVVLLNPIHPPVGIRFLEEPKRTVWVRPDELTLAS